MFITQLCSICLGIISTLSLFVKCKAYDKREKGHRKRNLKRQWSKHFSSFFMDWTEHPQIQKVTICTKNILTKGMYIILPSYLNIFMFWQIIKEYIYQGSSTHNWHYVCKVESLNYSVPHYIMRKDLKEMRN